MRCTASSSMADAVLKLKVVDDVAEGLGDGDLDLEMPLIRCCGVGTERYEVEVEVVLADALVTALNCAAAALCAARDDAEAAASDSDGGACSSDVEAVKGFHMCVVLRERRQ